MSKLRVFAPLLILGLVSPAPWASAQDPLPLTTANGCDVFVGEGEGEITSPLTARGTFLLQRLADGETFTVEVENVTFPPTPEPDGVTSHRVTYANFRFLEDGVKGTIRYDQLAVVDSPVAPTSAFFKEEGVVVRASGGYKTGGFSVQGTVLFTDFPAAGTFTATATAVLCRGPK